MNKVGWRSPSNIALVKYWGKYANQLPANPSISFTLSTSVTETFLSWETAPQGKGGNIVVLLDDVLAPSFEPKIAQFFKRVAHVVPFFNDYNFVIKVAEGSFDLVTPDQVKLCLGDSTLVK